MALKYENQIRLAREASANVINGGASAHAKVTRLKRMGGGYEADLIVNRVYTHPLGTATYKCGECDQDYVDPQDAAECCDPEGEMDEHFHATGEEDEIATTSLP